MATDFTFSELVDVSELQKIADALYTASGIPIGIVDVTGKVLVGSGWQRICTDFHRKHPITAKRCKSSDLHILKHIRDNDFIDYKCENGLRDIAVPIIIADRHLATLYIGQFYYDDETPDIETFRAQAHEFDFDEKDYLSALSEVPVYSRKGIQNILHYYKHFVHFISNQGLAKLHLEEEILERKRIETMLEDQLKFITNLLNAISVPIFYKDSDFIYQKCNTAYCEAIGIPHDEVIGHTTAEVFPNQYSEVYEVKDRELFESGGTQVYEATVLGAEGDSRDVIFSKAVVTIDGKKRGIIGVMLDITDRMNAERESRRLRSLLDSTFNSMPSVLIVVDPTGKVTNWNLLAEERIENKSQPSPGQHLSVLFPSMEKCMELVHKAIQEGSPQRREKIKRTLNGEVRYEDIMVFPLEGEGQSGAVIRVDNITERVRMEDMMVQTEKMLSVGGLAAGMAHEINNPLGIILQCIQNIERRLSTELPANISAADELDLKLESVTRYMHMRRIDSYIDGIRDAASRAARIVRNMLDFSRKSESKLTPTDINALLLRTLELASSDYDMKKNYDFKQVEIVKEFSTTLPTVDLIQTEIEQVILNVLRNAAEAMATADLPHPPRITLRTASEGAFVRIELEDNGPGLPEDQRKRIFEPFYTTKEPGIGTGLGLSVSYFIITTNHSGEFFVESAPGKGANFIIRLPVT